jgi:hypothetical protein
VEIIKQLEAAFAAQASSNVDRCSAIHYCFAAQASSNVERCSTIHYCIAAQASSNVERCSTIHYCVTAQASSNVERCSAILNCPHLNKHFYSRDLPASTKGHKPFNILLHCSTPMPPGKPGIEGKRGPQNGRFFFSPFCQSGKGAS